MSYVSGSFRDPSAGVCEVDGRIFRVIHPCGQPDYNFVKKASFFKKAQESGRLIACNEVPRSMVAEASADDIVIEHPLIEFISYPYEWPFECLKSAALLHLDLQIEALREDIVFSDASAYNVQFKSGSPIFIDATSLKQYKADEPWIAHKQFCESFLAPLILQARKNIPFQAWYRGNLEGIPVRELANMLAWKDCLSPTIFCHIILPSILDRQDAQKVTNKAQRSIKTGISKNGYTAILYQLRRFIEGLNIRSTHKSVWQDYSKDNSYLPRETEDKVNMVRTIVSEKKPHTILDIGCNDGVFSIEALDAGATLAIGLDSDHPSLNRAFMRAKKDKLNFLPLYMDIANPSPSQGFSGAERSDMMQRLGKVDMVLALAVVHHLAIGRNVPLEKVIQYIVNLGKSGLIEFVPKSDAMVQRMLAIREDIFTGYNRESFISALQKHAKIESITKTTVSGREVFYFTA